MLPSIHNLQSATAGRNRSLDFSNRGRFRLLRASPPCRMACAVFWSASVSCAPTPPVPIAQNKTLSGLLGRIEARFNPNDLRAANVNLNQWKAEPHKLRGAELSRSLEAVSQAEAQRISDRRTAASPWMNFAPQADTSRTSSALFERMPAGFDSWSSEQRARFQPRLSPNL